MAHNAKSKRTHDVGLCLLHYKKNEIKLIGKNVEAEIGWRNEISVWCAYNTSRGVIHCICTLYIYVKQVWR